MGVIEYESSMEEGIVPFEFIEEGTRGSLAFPAKFIKSRECTTETQRAQR
ncbi:MAG: hypothetical protein HYU64_06295 [Armatimonadetes bacterium]|nr:hypothetical protein [Armatimonadota bacterium]